MPNYGSGWNWSQGSSGSSSQANTGTGGRSGYTAGWFALEMDNQAVPVGFVTQMDGGAFRSDAIENPIGSDPFIAKFAGKPKYDDITIGIGMPSTARLFQWVASAVSNRPERHTGALVGFDNFAGRRERSRRIFDQALISEIAFPALDASSNTAANITLKITPETLRYQVGKSTFAAQQARDEDIKQKRWSTSNFGFKLDGIWGSGTQRNIRVEGFTIKQSVLSYDAGNRLESYKEPGRIEYPNLVVTFGEENFSTWYAWWQESVVAGNITRRSGAISWYAPDLKTELMRLNVDGVGILGLEVDRYEAGKEQIARGKVTLFVENMTLVPGAGNV